MLESLADTEAYRRYQTEADLDNLSPGLDFNNLKIPSSAWLSLWSIAILAASVISVQATPTSSLQVRTPNGFCLNARYGPGTQYGIHTCVRNGAKLAPVSKVQGQWLQLSTGRWVYAAHTTYNSINQTPQAAPPTPITSSPRIVSTPRGECLNVRTEPKVNSSIVNCLPDGSALEVVVSEKGQWLQLTSGHWVYAPYTQPQGSNPHPKSPRLQETRAVLALGGRGQAVRNLQSVLKKTGYYSGAIDGAFGRQTEKAVRRFQAANGIAINGTVDPPTKQLLARLPQ